MTMLNNQNGDANQQGYMDQHRVLIKSVWVIITLLYHQPPLSGDSILSALNFRERSSHLPQY